MKKTIVIIMLMLVLCSCYLNFSSSSIQSDIKPLANFHSGDDSSKFPENASASTEARHNISKFLIEPDEKGRINIPLEYSGDIHNAGNSVYWLDNNRFVYFDGIYLYGVDLISQERKLLMEVFYEGTGDYHKSFEDLFFHIQYSHKAEIMSTLPDDDKLFFNSDKTVFYVPTYCREEYKYKYSLHMFSCKDFSYIGKIDMNQIVDFDPENPLFAYFIAYNGCFLTKFAFGENLIRQNDQPLELPTVDGYTIRFELNKECNYLFNGISPSGKYFKFINLTKSNIEDINRFYVREDQPYPIWYEIYDRSGNMISEFIDESSPEICRCEWVGDYTCNSFNSETNYFWGETDYLLINDELYNINSNPVDKYTVYAIKEDSNNKCFNFIKYENDGTGTLICNNIAPFDAFKFSVNPSFTACAYKYGNGLLGISQWQLP